MAGQENDRRKTCQVGTLQEGTDRAGCRVEQGTSSARILPPSVTCLLPANPCVPGDGLALPWPALPFASALFRPPALHHPLEQAALAFLHGAGPAPTPCAPPFPQPHPLEQVALALLRGAGPPPGSGGLIEVDHHLLQGAAGAGARRWMGKCTSMGWKFVQGQERT